MPYSNEILGCGEQIHHKLFLVSRYSRSFTDYEGDMTYRCVWVEDELHIRLLDVESIFTEIDLVN